jgi:hypothetical protein
MAQEQGMAPPAPSSPPAPEGGQMQEDDTVENLKRLDAHIESLPPELQTQFQDGFRKYDDLPELLGMLMPDAYEYFKILQQAVRQPQPQQTPNSPEASAPATPPGEPAQAPLLGSANTPAKDTSALSGLAG